LFCKFHKFALGFHWF